MIEFVKKIGIKCVNLIYWKNLPKSKQLEVKFVIKFKIY